MTEQPTALPSVTATVRVRLESPARRILASDRVALAVGHAIDDGSTPGASGDRVLVHLSDGAADIVDVASENCLSVPESVASEDAALVPHLARALWSWHTLGLELGETALCSGSGAAMQLFALVARWRGAAPVICLTTDANAAEGCEVVLALDVLEALTRLQSLAGQAPGVAAVDLSHRASLVAIVLEALPRFGRLMIAGTNVAPFTTDVYTDIHRKGTVIRSGPPDLGALFADLAGWRSPLRRAFLLMADANRAREVRDALITP